MLDTDAEIARLAARSLGHLTRRSLLDAGLSAQAIDDRRRHGLLLDVHDGVYRHAATPPTQRGATMAAALAAGPRAVASHRSAAVIHGLRGITAARPEITIGAGFNPRLRGVTAHRSRQLEERDRCRVGGIPATTIPRTLLDLGAVLAFERVELAAQDALITRKVRPSELVCLLERVGRRGRPGTAALRAIVHQSIPDERLETELERLLFDLILRAGVPAPELQVWLPLPDTTDGRVDFCWHELRRVVEADGRRWHAAKRDFERDLVRSRGIQRLGYSHHRYGWRDVVETPDRVIAELRSLNWRAEVVSTTT